MASLRKWTDSDVVTVRGLLACTVNGSCWRWFDEKARSRLRALGDRAGPCNCHGKSKLSDVLQDLPHLCRRESAQRLSANVAQFYCVQPKRGCLHLIRSL